MTESIVKSLSVANLVNQRAGVLAKLKLALDLLAEAEELAAGANIGFPTFILEHSSRHRSGQLRISGRYGHADSRPEIDEMVRQLIDASAWEFLMAESGLRTFMDAQTRQKWDEALREEQVPALTEASVAATFESLYAARGQMFEAGVIACFKALSWHYKTNQPFKFGKRIVVTRLTGFYSHERCNQLDDLMRVFSILDSKPEPDHRHGMYAALSEAGAFHAKRAGEFQNDYFKLRWFKNHNGHLTFLRSGLVDKLNQIIAKHYPGALPAAREH